MKYLRADFGATSMMMLTPKFNIAHFYYELQACTTLDACAALFRTTSAPFGFDSFAVGEIDVADRNRCVFFILEWPEDWRKFYLSSGFVQRDPLIEMIPALGRPFSWSELRKSRKLSQIQREALKMIADHGWTEGLAVPVPRGGTRFGLVSLVGHGEALNKQQIALLCLASRSVLARARMLAGASGGFALRPAGLSDREIESLRLVADGCSDGEIAAALGVARSTAHDFVEGAKRRLGARTRAQLAALAVSLGIIDGA